MKSKKLIIIILFNFFLFGLSESELNKIKDKVSNDLSAPDFTLNLIQSDSSDSTGISFVEEEITLSHLNGKVILINFWATWCGPCRLEIPDLNDLYDQYKDRGLEVLAISISDGKEQLESFIKAYDIKYPLLYGDQNIMQDITYNYGGVYSIPTSVLINRNNELTKIYPGAILKQYDPYMYFDLVSNIETEISIEVNSKINNEKR